ncbi:MAG TPA: GntR family transcriptional regulator [Caldilineae bacterium]|nr:GntR family transcriptional regulator [Caldilineae bacterium]
MVERNHPLPLYYQLMQELRSRIEQGEWKPGDLFPSERELCQAYGVSRMTVRQALAELVNEGLLRRDQGRGTFVAKPKIRKRLSRLTSFTEEMRSRGKQAGARVLRLEMVPARPRIADFLEIDAERPIALIERLRLADGEPIGIECSYLSFKGCEAVLREDLTRSLYEILSKRFGVIPTRAQEEIEVGTCNPREAQILGIQPGDPVMLIRRRTLDQNGRPFEFVESVYRGDNYILSVELMAEEPSAHS